MSPPVNYPRSDFSHLTKAIPSAPSIGLDADVFRFSDLTYANLADLITGSGSKKAGGCWNAKRFATLYFSLDPETALAETFGHSRHQGIPDSEMTPAALTACRVHVGRVLDLTNRVVRRLLRVTVLQLTSEPWRARQHSGQEALTQAIGRLPRQSGFQGLLVMSARKGAGRNLVLFRENLSDQEVEVLHPKRLPPRRRRIRR